MAISEVKNLNEIVMTVRDTTAIAEDVTEGKIFYDAKGVRTIGTNQGGGTAFAPDYVSFRDYPGETLDLTGLDTSNITNMEFMFYNCWQVYRLDLSNFNTSNVTSMWGMFQGCSSLTTLTLGTEFVTIGAYIVNDIFSGCSSLTNIYYEGTQTQFNTNCDNIKSPLSKAGQDITVHCSDGDMVIEYDGSIEVSAIGAIMGTAWDTDFMFTSQGDGVYTYTGLVLAADNEFKIRFNRGWEYNYGVEAGGSGVAVNYIGFETSPSNYFRSVGNVSPNSMQIIVIAPCTIDISVTVNETGTDINAMSITYKGE